MALMNMETLGIKATIYDFFAYFIPGIVCNICIIIAIYFTNGCFSIPFHDIFGKELLSLIPNWIILIILIFVNYIFGLLLSTLSSIIIEKWLMKKIPFFSKYFSINNILTENVYNHFIQKFTKEFNLTFEKNNMRLLITLIENRAVSSYNTAFAFLTIYGTYRNICIIFFIIGITTIIVNILQCIFPIFGIIMIFLSIISLVGYIRFYRYFISQIISAYINISIN
jgi:hypothetical protein